MSRNYLQDNNNIYKCLKCYHIFSYLFLDTDLYGYTMLAFWKARCISLRFNENRLMPLLFIDIWINEVFEMLSTFYRVQTLGQWPALKAKLPGSVTKERNLSPWMRSNCHQIQPLSNPTLPSSSIYHSCVLFTAFCSCGFDHHREILELATTTFMT